MARRRRYRNRSRAVKEIQAGVRRLTRGLRLLAKEMTHELTTSGTKPRRRASPGRRIHGRYIGLIRNLPARKKAKVQMVRARRGVEAAIRMARQMRLSR